MAIKITQMHSVECDLCGQTLEDPEVGLLMFESRDELKYEMFVHGWWFTNDGIPVCDECYQRIFPHASDSDRLNNFVFHDRKWEKMAYKIVKA